MPITSTSPSYRSGAARAVLPLLAIGVGLAFASPATGAEVVGGPPVATTISTKDAERATNAVAAEDRRITEVRTVSSLARWQGKNWKTPYRLSTGTGYTLVLTPRPEPYTVTDLLRLAPQTFLRMNDGAYLLTEHIAVMPRATLRLSQPGGLKLRLSSSSKGFATIVSLGGRLELVGEQGARMRISSWDLDAAKPDLATSDGRAYLRAVGGQFAASSVDLSDLGFWSGRTGGLSLTGTDRPNTGAIESIGQAGAAGAAGKSPSLLADASAQPAGPLRPGQPNPNMGFTVPAQDYVSGRISGSTIDGNAFGLFVSGANGLQISESTVRNSQIAGVVLHRYVTNGVISTTTSAHNVGDGFTVDRATTGISITQSTATDNSGSGFRISGRPLSEGPSAVGSSLQSYGNNSITGSTATGNGQYGIEVLGGVNIGLQNNRIRDHTMGIMVNGPATRVSITGNQVQDVDRHGIALVNDVSDSTVTGNVVNDAATGVYLRQSSAQVKGNTVQTAHSHGVSLVGDVDGTEVAFNVLAGSGASALDMHRGRGTVASATNNIGGWSDTTPWYFWFKKLLHPMTTLWVTIAVLMIVSAVRSWGRDHNVVHPYAHQMAHQDHLPVPSHTTTIDVTDDPAPDRDGADQDSTARAG